jgi:hypothetical protein
MSKRVRIYPLFTRQLDAADFKRRADIARQCRGTLEP